MNTVALYLQQELLDPIFFYMEYEAIENNDADSGSYSSIQTLLKNFHLHAKDHGDDNRYQVTLSLFKHPFPTQQIQNGILNHAYTLGLQLHF